jgi:hypothetical protein
MPPLPTPLGIKKINGLRKMDVRKIQEDLSQGSQ